MNVVDDSGARGLAQIHAEIETLRSIDSAKRGLATLRQVHQLICSFFSGFVEFTNMLVGNDEQVTANVRVDIENDKAM